MVKKQITSIKNSVCRREQLTMESLSLTNHDSTTRQGINTVLDRYELFIDLITRSGQGFITD